MQGNLFLAAVIVCLFSFLSVTAQTDFRLVETAAKVFIKPENLQINLAFENKSRSFPAKIRLEILDANDVALAQTDARATIKRGKCVIADSIAFVYAAPAENYLWLRLRYSITSAALEKDKANSVNENRNAEISSITKY